MVFHIFQIDYCFVSQLKYCYTCIDDTKEGKISKLQKTFFLKSLWMICRIQI